jgi:hypothetical protein
MTHLTHYRGRWLLVVVATALLAACKSRHPNDAEMRQRFVEQRQQFDSLRALALADTALSAVAPTWYRTRQGADRTVASALLPEERWRTYQHLFSQLGLGNGVDMDTVGVTFRVSDLGIAGAGSTKAVAFFAHPRRGMSLCASLDSLLDTTSASHGACYRELGEGWFLYVDW